MDPTAKLAIDAAAASNQLVQLGAIGAMCFLQFVAMTWLVARFMPDMQNKFHAELNLERESHKLADKETRTAFLDSLREIRLEHSESYDKVQSEIKNLAQDIRHLVGVHRSRSKGNEKGTHGTLED